MKKISAILQMLLILSVPAFSFEWGGLVKNESKASTKTFKSLSITQSDSAYLWAKQPLSEDSSWYFIAEGMYQYYLYVIPGTNVKTSFLNMADLDLFKLSGSLNLANNPLSFDAGRFLVKDFTQSVFAQDCDGLKLSYKINPVEIELYGGCTYLLNKKTVTMLSENGVESSSDTKSIYEFSKLYVPAMLSLNFANVFANQSLGLQGMAFLDVPEMKYNRYYAAFEISGPILQNVYYSFVTNFGSVNFKNLMNYSKLVFMIYPLENAGINLGATYSSGNYGPFSSFVTVTSNTAYKSSLSPQESGIIKPFVSAIYTMDSLYLQVNAAFPFDMPDLNCKFSGIAADFTAGYNLFSDLNVEVVLNTFTDLCTNGANNNYSVTLNASLSF